MTEYERAVLADGRADDASLFIFSKSLGELRVDDRRVLNGIIFVNLNGLRWRDEPEEYRPHTTLYNRWKRWGVMGVVARMMESMSAHYNSKTSSLRVELLGDLLIKGFYSAAIMAARVIEVRQHF